MRIADYGHALVQCRALAYKQFQVAFGRRHFWTLQVAFVGYLVLIVLYNLYSEGWTTSYEQMDLLGEGMIRTLSIFAYVALLFIAPAMAAGALQEESESGMLEVLEAAPLTTRRLFAGIVGARLLLILHYVVAAAPIFIFPLVIGGTSSTAILWRSLFSMLIGSIVTTLYVMTLFALGRKTAFVYSRLVLFVLVTPFSRGFGMGFRIFFLITAVLIVSGLTGWAWHDDLRDVVFTAAFPFWGLGISILQGPENLPMVSYTSWIVMTFLLVVFVRDTRHAIESWLRSQAERRPSRDIRSRKPRRLADRVDRLRRLVGGAPDEAEEVDPALGEKLLLSTRVLSHLSGMKRWIYGWTGRNPLVAKNILERSHDVVLSWSVALMMAFVVVAQVVNTQRGPTAAWLGVLDILIFLVSIIMIATIGARLLPSRQRAATPDVFLSTPLTPTRVLLGYLGTTVIRCWPAVTVLAVAHAWPFGRPGHYLWSLPSFLVFLLSILLLVGISAWVGVFWHRIGQRLGMTLLFAALAVFPAFFLSDENMMIYHPVRAWFGADPASPTELLFTAAGLLLANGILYLGFILGFDRAAGRR